MDFIEYLKSKKIDPVGFKKNQPEQYQDWLELFNQVHPDSFTQQKLFLINKIRRSYTLKDAAEAKKPSGNKMLKPKMKPLKPKTT